MPCRDDYPEPSELNRRLQVAAKCIRYLNKQLSVKTPKWIREQSKESFAHDDRLVPLLCAMVKELTKKQKKELIYNGYDKKARRLADWWEEHEEADRRRIKIGKKEKQMKVARKTALSKLSGIEREALGL